MPFPSCREPHIAEQFPPLRINLTVPRSGAKVRIGRMSAKSQVNFRAYWQRPCPALSIQSTITPHTDLIWH
jgi:hypothetical protein